MSPTRIGVNPRLVFSPAFPRTAAGTPATNCNIPWRQTEARQQREERARERERERENERERDCGKGRARRRGGSIASGTHSAFSPLAGGHRNRSSMSSFVLSCQYSSCTCVLLSTSSPDLLFRHSVVVLSMCHPLERLPVNAVIAPSYSICPSQVRLNLFSTCTCIPLSTSPSTGLSSRLCYSVVLFIRGHVAFTRVPQITIILIQLLNATNASIFLQLDLYTAVHVFFSRSLFQF